MIKTLTPVLLCSAILLSCANNDSSQKPESIKDTSNTTAAIAHNKDTTAPVGYFKVEGDSVIVAPFEIGVSLSPKAKDKMISSKETMIIDVSMTGTPKDPKLYAEDGQFYVASAEKEIVYGQTVRFDNIRIAKKKFDQLTDKNVYVNAFVYSGRKSSPNNLLSGDLLSDSISNIVNKTFVLKAKLIYGDD